MEVEPTVPVLVFDDQVPGGHHLIPLRASEPQPMDHELEGEDLPPDRSSAPAEQDKGRPKSVKKSNIKAKKK